MPIDLNNILVVGISSRALFGLEKENSIFENELLGKYIEYQRDNENAVLPKGTAFLLIEALLKLNCNPPIK